MNFQQPSSASRHGKVMEGSERKYNAIFAGINKYPYQGHRFDYLPEIQVTTDAENCGCNTEYSENNDSRDSKKLDNLQKIFRDNWPSEEILRRNRRGLVRT